MGNNIMDVTAPPGAMPPAARTRPGRFDLFLISFLLLFLELSSIRWFGSTVVFLTFFTNLVLLGCFVGMSVGCLAASRERDFLAWTLPLTLAAVVLSWLTTFLHGLFGKLLIDVGGQGSPQQVFFGTEYRAYDPSMFVVPIEVIAGMFFLLVALSFVGLGQAMGRAFNAIPNRIAAYTASVLGSLAGIVGFGLLSAFRVQPVVWYGLSAVLLFRFLKRKSAFQINSAIGLVIVLGFLAYDEGMYQTTIWSPYYKIAYSPETRSLLTNNISHQGMTTIGEAGGAYMLPHLINRDAGGKPFGEAMIIGAGSGNDVAAALAAGVGHVDAVEIEPVLNEIGRADHPNRPYDSPRVSIRLEDGRSFVRTTDKTYDLISYAVVDSLVLHSGYSSLRLESFLFTEEAFRDIASKLNTDGVFVMYNYYRQGWIVGRLEKMVEKVFQTEPIVISMPFVEQIAPDESMGGRYTFLIAGKPGCKRLEAIRTKFREKAAFWLSERPLDNEEVNGFSPHPPQVAGVPDGRWQKIAPCRVVTTGIDQLPSDDWPFLYLRKPAIPRLNIRGMAIIAALSVILLLAFAPGPYATAKWEYVLSRGRIHAAGDEKRGAHGAPVRLDLVRQLGCILCNLGDDPSLKPVGAVEQAQSALAVLLALDRGSAGKRLPADELLLEPAGAGKGRCVVRRGVRADLLRGCHLRHAFRDSSHPDVDFGSNIGGVILGGLCENLSLILGFSHLILVALAFYVLSAVLRTRVAAAVPMPRSG